MRDAEKPSRFGLVLDFLKGLLGKKAAPPGDPYAHVMAPVRHRSFAAKRRSG